MAISAADIKGIALTEDDFGHELRVGALLRAVPNAQCEHSGTYKDPHTGKPRQFDYRWWLEGHEYAQRLGMGLPRVTMAVECKNLNPEYPLVICGTRRQETEAFHQVIFSHGELTKSGQVFSAEAGSAVLRDTQSRSFYEAGAFVGKSLFRAKFDSSKKPPGWVAGPDTELYDKWSQALCSGFGLAESACNCAMQTQRVFSVVLPVVVVSDDSLWRLQYGENGTLASDPEKIENSEYFVAHPVWIDSARQPHRFLFSHVHFFTLAAFGSFVTRVEKDFRLWESLFSPGLLRLIQ